MERVTGIGGVFFKARDPAALRAWYRERLGIPLDADGGWFPFEWREPGTTVFCVFDAATDYLGDGSFMVNFRVEDLDAVLSALRTEGVSVNERVEETEQGRFGWAVDPEGNRIELWQPAPGQ